eukprot:m.346923 g.346923  ORF g.346923 m.346923 type:complete len:363 (-) comp27918_c0_seq2:3756-4844(-)
MVQEKTAHPLFEGLSPREQVERQWLCIYIFGAIASGFYAYTPTVDLLPPVMVALAASSAVCVGLWKLVAFLVNRGGSSASGHHSSTSSRSTGTAEREQHIPLPTTSAEAIDWIRKCPESDPYRMLCLHKSATQTDIKKAYRQLSLKTHPDKTKISGAEEAFKKLGKVAFILGDEERRAEFDEEEAGNHEMDAEFSDILENLKRMANEMQCSACQRCHPKTKVDRAASASRYSLDSEHMLPSQNGDLWAETEMLFMWHFYLNENGTIYEVTEWAICQGLDRSIEPNSSRVTVRLLPEKEGGRRGGGKKGKKKGKGRNQRRTELTEEEIMEFLAELIRRDMAESYDDDGAPPQRQTKKKGKKKR